MAPVGVVSAEPAMCAYAFDVMVAALNKTVEPPMPRSIPDAGDVGIFVTWNARHADPARGMWDLRGCIGTLSPTRLSDALPTYAKHSAFRDSRFVPLTKEELPSLQAVVSVLSGFEPAPGGVYDWVVGVHGIVLSLSGGYSATYLPEICADQGWSKEQCIASLARKSGFRGRLTPEVIASAKLTRYGTSAEYTGKSCLDAGLC
jgi:AMME syndrome candidate gene 1 protein